MVAVMDPKTIQVQTSSALTDEVVRNGSVKKVEKRGNVGKLEGIRMAGMIIRGLELEMLLLLPQTLGQGRGNQRNQARGKALTLGAEEARHDLHIDMGFRCEIEIASGQLVEIYMVIKGCKLEIESHVFDINLIPFSHGSFDMIIESVVHQLCRLRLEKKSYADNRRKPLEFSVGDYVLLKVSSWKGVVRFGKKGKLAPIFVEPFEIVKKVGIVAYRLDLPEELDGVHDTFHVSNIKKCLAYPTLQVPLDKI
nr:putative reverse transcriptase domain-containing protein [Tanacetum cinerariifolium]